jgi:hypothetical protein
MPVTSLGIGMQARPRMGCPLSRWTTSGSPGPSPADYCFSADCERVLVATGGAADTSDGDAGFADMVSTAGS